MNNAARMHGRAVWRALWCAVLACALGATPAAAVTAVPAVPAAGASAVTPATAGRGNVTQSVRGDHVRIEGKLYSPQALFLVSRRTEAFGRDAVVPNYLPVEPDAGFLPYRLRTAGAPAAAAAATTAPVPAPAAATTRSSDTRH